MKKSQNSIKEFYKKHSQELRFSHRIFKILSLIPSWVYQKTVLDVGCGNCFITKAMNVYGTVTGIDIEGDICTYKSDIKYDVVTCFDVLEHVENFYEAVVNILDLCKPGGLVIVNQPEHTDSSQPIDNLVTLGSLMHFGKPIYLENYQSGKNESYNFIVFKT